MMEDELEVKVGKVVKEPRISLTMISRYIVSTENAKKRILMGCKYPSDYIPKYYEPARKFVCTVFGANFADGYELYFEEFARQAAVYRKEAKDYPEKKDDHKNRIYSAKGLDALVAMSQFLMPVLETYVLHSNLHRRRDFIMKNGVRIGAMADMLLSDQAGATQVGFLKFNFSSTKLKKEEAAARLYVLNAYFKKEKIELDPKSCMLVDVAAWRIYTLADLADAEPAVDQATIEIRDSWDLI